ncbi:hypothetical protein SJAG_04269 [Schizosaccharomyces japonicus yFS275]|uniref:Uncharacterized protein n=1 Tax=Schizosaccharomyces japonicus (strain yFS275 / FY16936) TaxID=402676 RepID=B6K6D9_SCHJY|nr:hypothetical protein SJAG_04269 [Schizosaccharomyces japonicus yFS275]EEB09093.1 hypothetical protein SJAG_04269 [Schizosaccharomyces japonicus yFS275]
MKKKAPSKNQDGRVVSSCVRVLTNKLRIKRTKTPFIGYQFFPVQGLMATNAVHPKPRTRDPVPTGGLCGKAHVPEDDAGSKLSLSI